MDSIAVVSGAGAPSGPGGAYPARWQIGEVWSLDARRWPGSTFLIQYEPRSYAAVTALTAINGSGDADNRKGAISPIPLTGISFADLPEDGSYKRYYWNNLFSSWNTVLTAAIHGSGWVVWTSVDPEGDEPGNGLVGVSPDAVDVDRVRRSMLPRLANCFSRLLMMPERRNE